MVAAFVYFCLREKRSIDRMGVCSTGWCGRNWGQREGRGEGGGDRGGAGLRRLQAVAVNVASPA